MSMWNRPNEIGRVSSISALERRKILLFEDFFRDVCYSTQIQVVFSVSDFNFAFPENVDLSTDWTGRPPVSSVDLSGEESLLKILATGKFYDRPKSEGTSSYDNI
ncbi:hypothetical protein CDAR_549171 [Caerostris darwini]|uniref:Uncharacterized protein n=1 Tax=Caerostris darwini TaxID=1538125 RepID=A0AAV4WL46_9ARAC|nr:hypothetical protein CDAR_549171 [Caerostris darwini]